MPEYITAEVIKNDSKNERYNIWPICFIEEFNNLPYDVRCNFGLYGFKSAIKNYFNNLCQHKRSNDDLCKKCKPTTLSHDDFWLLEQERELAKLRYSFIGGPTGIRAETKKGQMLQDTILYDTKIAEYYKVYKTFPTPENILEQSQKLRI